MIQFFFKFKYFFITQFVQISRTTIDCDDKNKNKHVSWNENNGEILNIK